MNNGEKESRCGSQVDCFSFYVYIPLFLRIMSLHILRLKNATNIHFDLIKNTYFPSICADCKTLHVDAAIFTVARDSGRLLYFGRVIFLFFSVHQIFDIPGPIFAKLYHTTRHVLK